MKTGNIEMYGQDVNGIHQRDYIKEWKASRKGMAYLFLGILLLTAGNFFIFYAYFVMGVIPDVWSNSPGGEVSDNPAAAVILTLVTFIFNNLWGVVFIWKEVEDINGLGKKYDISQNAIPWQVPKERVAETFYKMWEDTFRQTSEEVHLEGNRRDPTIRKLFIPKRNIRVSFNLSIIGKGTDRVYSCRVFMKAFSHPGILDNISDHVGEGHITEVIKFIDNVFESEMIGKYFMLHHGSFSQVQNVIQPPQ